MSNSQKYNSKAPRRSPSCECIPNDHRNDSVLIHVNAYECSGTTVYCTRRDTNRMKYINKTTIYKDWRLNSLSIFYAVHD